MKKIILRIIAGCIFAFLLLINTVLSSNTGSKSLSLDLLHSQAIECGVECVLFPGCSIKMDCKNGVCVEHEGGRFTCGLMEVTCWEECQK